MKKAKALLALVIISLFLIPQGIAADVWELAKSENYKEKTGGMLGRGFLNVATSPVDLVVQVVDQTKKGPPLLGTLTGLGGGIGCTALRASSGIVDVALFWVPGFNGFPVGKSYSNCLETEQESVKVEQVVVQPVSVVSQPLVTQSEPMTTVSEPVEEKPVRKIKRDPYRYVKK